jgi:thiol-disulfide isomerase/thioredoxin
MVSLQAALVAMALSGCGQTTLLDFYADWCGPCRSMDPTVKQLAALGYPVRQVNIDRERELANRFHITSIPCFVMVVDGREVDRNVGPTSMQHLAQMCRKATPPTSAPVQLLSNAGPAAVMPAIDSETPLHSADSAAFVQPSRNAAPAHGAPADRDFIACSVRLRVEDPEGRSCGSGTIIDARQGQALIVTCGHIFRDSKGKGQVEVDLFGPTGVRQVTGHVVSYDLVADVGLVSIRTAEPLAAARVAPAGYQFHVSDPVVTVGCDGGHDPLVRHTRIAPGKYAGPPSVQVDELPEGGRSGGGLFTPDGMIIGVCNAADPTVHKGLYAALGAIHAELDRDQLAFVYQGQSPDTTVAVPPPAVASNEPPNMPATMSPIMPPAMPQETPRPVELVPTQTVQQPAAAADTSTAPLSKEEQALMDELHKKLHDGAEVIVIVRPRNDPQAKNEILMLDRRQ